VDGVALLWGLQRDPEAVHRGDASMDVDADPSHEGSDALHLPALASSVPVQRPVGKLLGHTARVCKIGFHPSGRFIATTR